MTMTPGCQCKTFLHSALTRFGRISYSVSQLKTFAASLGTDTFWQNKLECFTIKNICNFAYIFIELLEQHWYSSSLPRHTNELIRLVREKRSSLFISYLG